MTRMTTNMAKLNTKAASKTHRVLLFGGPKTGKSLIAGQLAEYYNLIWVDMENGHETLFQLPPEWQEKIELINLPDTRSYPIAIETCLKMVKGSVSICEQHGKVGCMICKRVQTDRCKSTDDSIKHIEIGKELFTDVDLPNMNHNSVVVFDSLTQLSNSAIAFITKDQPDDYKLNYDDWGNLGKLLDIFLSHIQQAGYNVIVISHEIEAETEGKKKTLVPVGGTRNFSRNIAKYFDHVIYAERKNRKHIFASSTQYATNILTGSRTDVRVEDAEKASLLAIFKPELYPETAHKSEAGKEGKKTGKVGKLAAKATSTSASKAGDILAKLKAKQK